MSVISAELEDIETKAIKLKEMLWGYMDDTGKEHKGVKGAMNELLDLIEELETL